VYRAERQITQRPERTCREARALQKSSTIQIAGCTARRHAGNISAASMTLRLFDQH
jgi:hypothetical protein